MLAHAEMDIARAPAPGRHVAPVLEGEVRRGREVRRPADELGEPGCEGVQHLPRRRARGLGIGGGGGGGGGRRGGVPPPLRPPARGPPPPLPGPPPGVPAPPLRVVPALGLVAGPRRPPP